MKPDKEKKDFSYITTLLRSDDPESIMHGFEQVFCAIQQKRLVPASDLAFRLFNQLVGIDWTHTLVDAEGLNLASDYVDGHLINTAETLERLAKMLREAASERTSHEKIKSQLEAEVLRWPLLSNYGLLHRNLEVAARHYYPTESYISGYRKFIDQLADEVEQAEER